MRTPVYANESIVASRLETIFKSSFFHWSEGRAIEMIMDTLEDINLGKDTFKGNNFDKAEDAFRNLKRILEEKGSDYVEDFILLILDTMDYFDSELMLLQLPVSQ